MLLGNGNRFWRLAGMIVVMIAAIGVVAFAGGAAEEEAPEARERRELDIQLPDQAEYRAQILEEIGVDPALFEEFSQAVSAPSEQVAVDIDEPIVIGMATPSFDISDVWERWYWTVQERLDSAGIPYEINFQAASRHDAHAEQRDQVEGFIAAGVDYIILGPTELLGQRTTIDMVHEAGIPLFIFNFTRPLEGDTETLLYTAHDHEYGGFMSGLHMAEYFGGVGKLAGLRMIPGDLDDQRWNGMMSVIEQTDIEVVYETYAEADRGLAFEGTIDMVSANPDLDMIYATSSAMALGAASALESLGMQGQIGIWGFGGTVDELEAMQAGRMAGSVFRYTDDAAAAISEAIKRHLEGRRDEIPQVFMGDFEMADDSMSVEQLREMAERAHRYSKGEMGLGI